MPASLLDGNVWLAAAFEAHPGHRSPREVLQCLGAGLDVELLQNEAG